MRVAAYTKSVQDKGSFQDQRGKIIMVNWNRFIPSDFGYDFERVKLAAHGVQFNEAVVFFLRF